MRPRGTTSRGGGFTLLELVIAIAIMGLLVGMVMKTSNAALTVGSTVVKTQGEEMLNQAFIELLDKRLTSLPGNTRFDVKVEDNGSQYLSTITLQKVPMSFTWGNQERIAKAVTLSTVRRRTGFLDIVLSYYENEILDDTSTTNTGAGANNSMLLSKEPFAEIVLLEDVRYFEWKFLDGTNLEWRYDWDLQGRLPLQMELIYTVGVDNPEIRQVFWLPPKQNPEILIREMMQNRPEPNPSSQ